MHKNLPQCIHWNYEEKYLVPGKLNLNEFAANPLICVPLRNAFLLAGVSEIGSAINIARTRTNGLRNLLDNVAKSATSHVRSVWPEYKDVRFDIRENGPSIETSIMDIHNSYAMSSRSDGFKRFVSFLLMISAPLKAGSVSNVLLLSDDPDAGLHPKGARHLRDELLRMGMNNYVVFATHSIFMIDRACAARHLIVSKVEEKTQIDEVNSSNIIDEEVVYNAIGFSLFEVLRQKNLVFEGWRDKTVFDTALGRLPSAYRGLKRAFDAMGRCHASGVKDFKRVSQLLQLAERDCLFVSDGDSTARQLQNRHQDERLHGLWVRYDEIAPSLAPVTLEDFIQPETVKRAVGRVAAQNPKLLGLDFAIKRDRGVLEEVSIWLRDHGVVGDDHKRFLNRLKDELILNLKTSQLRQEYYDFLARLASVVASGEIPTVTQSESATENIEIAQSR